MDLINPDILDLLSFKVLINKSNNKVSVLYEYDKGLYSFIFVTARGDYSFKCFRL